MLKELVTAYEALWERNAPIEEIVAFCREQVEPFTKAWCHNWGEVVLQNSSWGDMVLSPAFLNALSEHDDALLCQIGVYISRRFNLIYYHDCRALLQCTRRILSMKYVISDKIRGFFWHQMRHVPYRFTKAKAFDWHMCDSIFSDNRSMRKEVIRFKNTGYESFFKVYELIPKGVYFLDLQRRSALPDQIKHAIIHDSAPLFDMAMTLSGKKLSRGILRAILIREAENIVCHLLKNRLKALSAILTPQDLLFCICANNIGKGDKTMPSHAILDTFEELMPGICRNTIDQLGNTPLWYCLYDEDSEAIAQTLLKYGCDPDKRNHLNLSYRICRETKQYYDQAQKQVKEF